MCPPLFKITEFKGTVKGIIDKEYKINIPVLELGNWSISNKIVEVLEIVHTFMESSY